LHASNLDRSVVYPPVLGVGSRIVAVRVLAQTLFLQPEMALYTLHNSIVLYADFVFIIRLRLTVGTGILSDCSMKDKIILICGQLVQPWTPYMLVLARVLIPGVSAGRIGILSRVLTSAQRTSSAVIDVIYTKLNKTKIAQREPSAPKFSCLAGQLR
jgi:hypothetical protein